MDVDHRGGDLPPGLELLVGDVGNPVLDQRDVGAGAAHVEGNDFAQASCRPARLGFLQQLADVRGGADATRRAGQDRAHRHAAGVPYGGHSAVGLHDQHVLQLRVRLEPLSEVRQVAAEHRPDVGVDHRGAEAVELLDLGNDLVGEGGVQVRETLANDFRSLLLVGGVEVGEQETDRQRLSALPDQVLQVFDQGGLVQGPLHLAAGANSLRDANPQVARRQRLGRRHAQVVPVLLQSLPHLQQVAETIGCDEPDRSPFPFHQRVGGNSRPVDHQVRVLPAAGPEKGRKRRLPPAVRS